MVAAALHVLRCGILPYRQALDWMRVLQNRRREGLTGDTLLLLQHPPVITLGLSGGEEDVLLSPERRESLGVECVATERGGRATLHAPGQLVAYPILLLGEADLHEYLWKLEEVVLQVIAGWGLAGRRDEQQPGVWVGERKIAALGLALREGVAFHGLALNINNDLSLYRWIQPCGMDASRVTSLQAELGASVPLEAAAERLVESLCRVFHYRALVESSAPGVLFSNLVETPLWTT